MVRCAWFLINNQTIEIMHEECCARQCAMCLYACIYLNNFLYWPSNHSNWHQYFSLALVWNQCKVWSSIITLNGFSINIRNVKDGLQWWKKWARLIDGQWKRNLHTDLLQLHNWEPTWEKNEQDVHQCYITLSSKKIKDQTFSWDGIMEKKWIKVETNIAVGSLKTKSMRVQRMKHLKYKLIYYGADVGDCIHLYDIRFLLLEVVATGYIGSLLLSSVCVCVCVSSQSSLKPTRTFFALSNSTITYKLLGTDKRAASLCERTNLS